MVRSRRVSSSPTPVASPAATPPGDNISTRDIATIVATAQHLAHEPYDPNNAVALQSVMQSDVEVIATAMGCSPTHAKIIGVIVGILSAVVIIVLALLRYL